MASERGGNTQTPLRKREGHEFTHAVKPPRWDALQRLRSASRLALRRGRSRAVLKILSQHSFHERGPRQLGVASQTIDFLRTSEDHVSETRTFCAAILPFISADPSPRQNFLLPADLPQNCSCFCRRVGRFRDRPANNDMARSRGDCLSRRYHSHLISHG